MVHEYFYIYILQLQIMHLLDTLQNSTAFQEILQNLILQIQNQRQKDSK